MIPRWRLVLSGHNDAYTNMAIDEAMLESYRSGASLPSLRIYGWEPEGISLGYFQDPDAVLYTDRCALQHTPFVRRVTGGEAIYHGDSLTYSIVCSIKDLGLPKSVKDSYLTLCLFLINFYRSFGAQADFFHQENKDVPGNKRSDFCFAAGQDFDIAVDGKKIGGNAQKRHKDIIFQHGSIPIKLDMAKIRHLFREDLSGVEGRISTLMEIAGPAVGFSAAAGMLAGSFAKTFGASFDENGLSALERDSAAKFKDDKYATDEWNYSKKTGVVK
jgi:lipoate-protein ligase A